jgi:TraC-like protein
LEPLLRNGGIIHQSVGLADVQICTFPPKGIRENLGIASATPRLHRSTGMKKPSSRIREEIARLQDQLKQAETREAERIGRIALKSGIGEVEIDEADLQTAFEEIAEMFRAAKARSAGKKQAGEASTAGETSAALASGADAGGPREA